MQAYSELEKIFIKTSTNSQIMSVLSWDTSVMMPPAASAARGEQMAYLSSLSRELIFNERVRNLIDQAKEEKLNDWQQANLREIQKTFGSYEAIPETLQTELIKAGNEAEMNWREARKDSNFKLFAPYLEKTLNLTKKAAQCKADYYNIADPYEALLDDYDPGRKIFQIDKLFAELENTLPDLIEKIRAKQQNKPKLNHTFPENKQKELFQKIMQEFGFDFNKGRLDKSTHPFCGGSYNDIRITTRYNESDIFSGLYGVVHETGHALYEKNRPEKWCHQPVGSSLGMTIHESQSLFAEKQIGLSDGFVKYIQPKITNEFGVKIDEEQIKNYIRYVEPSFIRVDADEATYPLHVILRYKLERMLFTNEINVNDIPEIWNKEFKQNFGISPAKDSDGCLQDIHWAWGAFGYFPCYTLGSLFAAQLMAKAQTEFGALDQKFRDGNFSDAFNWLKNKIHQQGRFHATADALIQAATSEELTTKYFIEHLEDRYL